VHARLLPKTLFGEKYVDLVVPRGSSARAIRAGDVITQDRTRVGMELQQLMNDLLPLLRTVKPGELNATLSAFAGALEGRGDRIGDNLVRVEDYLRRLNPHLPSLKEDISRFADVAEMYGDAAPDLMAILRNTVTTSRTIVEKRDRLAAALTSTTGVAGTAEEFLDTNGDRLITLGRVSRPTLELFARYSPQYPCLLEGLVRQEKASEEAFRGGKMRITLEVVRQRPAYEPGEEPRWGERSGPDCRGLPHPTVPAPPTKLDDGTKSGGSGSALPGGVNVSATEAEQRAVGSLVAPVMGVPADEVPPVATLLFGPLARGTAVSVA
jgi:virulence factor Mce-like protein